MRPQVAEYNNFHMNTEVYARVFGSNAAKGIPDVKIIKGALDKEGNPETLAKGKSVRTIFEAVQKKRTLQVDVISGATVTSKTHLKALENALEQARVKE